MNIFKKELPWTGIALVILSISTLILSIRITINSVHIKQLKTLQKENAKSDQLTTNYINSATNLQKSVYKRLDDIEKNSPANCLKTHLSLHKDIVDTLLIIKQLNARIEQLESKQQNSKSEYTIIK